MKKIDNKTVLRAKEILDNLEVPTKGRVFELYVPKIPLWKKYWQLLFGSSDMVGLIPGIAHDLRDMVVYRLFIWKMQHKYNHGKEEE